VSTIVDDVFYGFLKQNDVKTIYTLWDLFQTRTNCSHLRHCAAAMFKLEALLAALTLGLVFSISLKDPGDRSCNLPLLGVRVPSWLSQEGMLEIIIFADILYGLGQLRDHSFNVAYYFMVSGTKFHSNN